MNRSAFYSSENLPLPPPTRPLRDENPSVEKPQLAFPFSIRAPSGPAALSSNDPTVCAQRDAPEDTDKQGKHFGKEPLMLQTYWCFNRYLIDINRDEQCSSA